MTEVTNIRKAKRGDENALMGLVHELADFEKAPDEVINTSEQLAVDLFDEKLCDCFILYFLLYMEGKVSLFGGFVYPNSVPQTRHW